jgi:uncharacterized protein YciI
MKKIALLLLIALSVSARAQSQYTFVFLNKKADADKITAEESKKIMDGHMANINRLAKEGKLLAAGPFEGGGGLFILNTQKVDEAKEWLSTDPGVQAKRWNIELLPYIPKRGGVCPVGEPYEMTNYTFIRFAPMVSKTTATDYPSILKKHDAYIREKISPDKVVTEATFGANEGGILVIREEVSKAVLDSDPGVLEGLLEIEVKKLYIAKGSFCEKK